MSLRLVPTPGHASSTTPSTTAPSAPGVPDPLRARLNPSTAPSTHPLETRLSAWRATQDATKLSLLARNYGIAEPVRRRMELADAAAGEFRPAVLGGQGRSFGSPWAAGGVTGNGVHADILLGREAEIGWEDVFVDKPLERVEGLHEEAERRAGI